MFNIQPGTGLCFTASRQIALGLGLSSIGTAIVRFLKVTSIAVYEYITQIISAEDSV